MVRTKKEAINEIQHSLIDPRFIPVDGTLDKNISIDSSEYIKISPIGGLSNSQIEWQVDPTSAGYMDLANSFIIANVKILKLGSDITAVDKTAMKAYYGIMMFKDLRTYLNDVEVSDTHPNLAPHAYFTKTLLQEKDVGAPSIQLYTPNAGVQAESVFSGDWRTSTQGFVKGQVNYNLLRVPRRILP